MRIFLSSFVALFLVQSQLLYGQGPPPPPPPISEQPVVVTTNGSDYVVDTAGEEAEFLPSIPTVSEDSWTEILATELYSNETYSAHYYYCDDFKETIVVVEDSTGVELFTTVFDHVDEVFYDQLGVYDPFSISTAPVALNEQQMLFRSWLKKLLRRIFRSRKPKPSGLPNPPPPKKPPGSGWQFDKDLGNGVGSWVRPNPNGSGVQKAVTDYRGLVK